ncbi:hypothetical protein AYI70_g6446, partial [Smittium culicis]
MALETAKFLTDIFVARTLKLGELRGAPAPLNQCLQ